MIAMLKGVLADRAGSEIVLDVGGVGYELSVPMSTLEGLPAEGGEARLFVQTVVREDAIQLFGFSTRQEKMAFQALVKVSGIGAKTALAVLSGMPVPALARAVASGESDLLTKIPGIGKKTAARLVLELKGKLGDELEAVSESAAPRPAAGSALADVLAGLMALGYTEREAAAAVKSLPEGVTVQEGIRLALRARA